MPNGKQKYKIAEGRLDEFMSAYKFDYKRRLGSQQQIDFNADDIQDGFYILHADAEYTRCYTVDSFPTSFAVPAYLAEMYIVKVDDDASDAKIANFYQFKHFTVSSVSGFIHAIKAHHANDIVAIRPSFCTGSIIYAVPIEGGMRIETADVSIPCPQKIFDVYFEPFKPKL